MGGQSTPEDGARVNPLMPSPLDVVVMCLSLAGFLAAAVVMVTLLWLLLVPKRRKQVVKILSGTKPS
jgi:hypothetical protein